MEIFKASVQYGDFKGTVAADNADHDRHLANFLKEKGLLQKGEFLIAASLYSSGGGGKVASTFVQAYLYQGGDTHDSIKDAIDKANGPIPVRVVDLHISADEFLAFFKRFSVMLTVPSLRIEGREFDRGD